MTLSLCKYRQQTTEGTAKVTKTLVPKWSKKQRQNRVHKEQQSTEEKKCT